MESEITPGTMSWHVVGPIPFSSLPLSMPHGSRPNSFNPLQYLYFIHLTNLIRSVLTLLEQDQQLIQSVVDVFKDGLCKSLDPRHSFTQGQAQDL
jgi:hypothetical protein